MLYVTQFDSDNTKSFTQTAFQNIYALQKQNINFEVRPIGQVLNWSDAPKWVQDSRTYFTDTQSDMSAAIIQASILDLLKAPYKSKNISVGYTAFETSMLPKWVVEGLNTNFKGMIVPSEYNKKALVNSGLTIGVEVVRHALPNFWLQDYADHREKDLDMYVFGYVGNWNARKNPRAILDAYIQAFPNPKNSKTALLLKTYNAGDLEGYIRSINDGQMREDIWIYDESWSEAQMLWAFNMMDCYVSAHKGEGFGLTLAQAAALGKPVAYTNYSAPTEWLSREKGHYPIEYTLGSVRKEDVSVLYEEMVDASLEWAEVDTQSLVDTLKELNSSRPRCGFVGSDLLHFRKQLSFDSLGANLKSAVEKLVGTELQLKKGEGV